MRQAVLQTTFASLARFPPPRRPKAVADRASPARLGPLSLLRAALSARQMSVLARRSGVLVVLPGDVEGEGRVARRWRQRVEPARIWASGLMAHEPWLPFMAAHVATTHTLHRRPESSCSTCDFYVR